MLDPIQEKPFLLFLNYFDDDIAAGYLLERQHILASDEEQLEL